MLTITVGIPTFRRPDVLLHTIKAVQLQNHPAVIEIVILDQTPDEETSSQFKQAINSLIANETIHYFQSDYPNLPTARNQIIQAAKGDIMLWIDDDVLLPDGFIEQHYKCYTDSICSKKIIAVAGLPFHRDQRLCRDVSVISISNYQQYTKPNFRETSKICDWPNVMIGANHSVLRSFAIKNMGYDEGMNGPFAYYEDADFTCRLRNNFPEHSIFYNPEAYLIHLIAPAGGCRIASYKKPPLHATTLSTHIFFWRHVTGLSKIKFLFKSLRLGPLRKKNILNPWLFISSCGGFIKSLWMAHSRKKQVVSVFSQKKVS